MSRDDLGAARSAADAPQVTVVTAPFDAHHERLFCGAFLDRLAARGLLRWSSTSYERCDEAWLEGSELLVLVRPRFPEVAGLLDGAAARGLPVLNVVDDNWLAAGREYPRFEALFTPGKPALEAFLDALRRADATAVFNPVLAEDVRPYARRVVELPPSVDLDLFAAPRPLRTEGLVVGYAGSPRWEDSGFAGLAAFLARHAEARLLVMGHEVPEALRGVDASRVTFVPWQRSYADYARALAIAAPDVLVAPLDATRFTASKVPFKLFDSAAVDAAGIYSRVPPYTRFVRDGENGLLVDNEPAAWEGALERLAGDPALRRRLAEAARRDVRSRYTIEHALPAFLALLAELLPGRLPALLPGRPPAALPAAGSGMTAPARPLRVAYVMHSALAGSERVLVRLLSALDRARVEPLVVLPADGPLRGELAALGVAVEILPTGWWIPATHWSAERHLAQLEGLDERAAALAGLLSARGADVVHTQFIVTLEGALAAAALGLPHVWHSRGLFGGGFPPAYLDEVPFFLAGVGALSDAVVCVSRQVEEQTATGVRAEALRVVYDGLDLAAFRGGAHETAAAFRARFNVAAGAPLVACIAGIQRRKGQLDLVEAAPALLARVPDAVLALAGGVNDDEYHGALRARIAELGLEGRFRFLGQLPDVRGLLAAATVLAHPSHSEGFGLGIVEAMAMGVPVVATRCGGPEEIVEDGRSGVLVPVGDAGALAAALVGVLAHPARAAALGAAASRRAEAFDLRATAAQTVAVYDEAVASHARRGAGAAEARALAARELSAEALRRARRAATPSLLPPAEPSAPHTPPLDSWLARLRKRLAGSST